MTVDRDDDFGELRDELGEVADLLALGPSDVVDERPSPDLWASIESQLAGEGKPSGLPGSGSTILPPSAFTADDSASADDDDRSVVSLAEARSKRRFRTALAAGAAAAVLLVGVPVGLALRESADEPIVVDAGADLGAVTADFTGSGSAELAERELRVETMGLVPLDDAVYELWLLEIVEGEPNDLVSVGLIEADGTYVIDESVDLDRFNVVDISIEPTDGDPAHSGNSVLRGELANL